MSIFSGFGLFLKAKVLTEYGAAVATASVIGGALTYSVIAGMSSGTGTAGPAKSERDSGIAVVRPGGGGASSSGLESSERRFCFTEDMTTCAEGKPTPGRIVKWCITEDDRFCRRTGRS
jgi:hypothetical protein